MTTPQVLRSPRAGRQRTVAAAVVAAVLAVFLALAAPAPATAGPTSPDPSFGTGDGLVFLDTSVREVTDAVLPVGDGRTVVVGSDIEGQAIYAARLQTDGSPDPSFGGGGGGAQFVPLGAPATAAGALLQPDGRIVIAGTIGSTTTDVIVLRLTGDGQLDPSFGTNGSVRINVGDIDQAFALVRQPDGAIVIAGRGGDAGQLGVAARVTPAGVLDPTFDGDGIVTTTFGATSAELDAVGLQSDGAVVVGGVTTSGGGGSQPLVGRLTASGSVDGGYGTGGRVDPAALPQTTIRALVVDGSDRAVAVGSTGPDEAVASTVTRITTAGTVDSSFGSSGSTTIAVSVRTVLQSITIDGAGRYVLSGLTNPTGDLPAGLAFGVVARLTGAGALDPAFGCRGTAVLEIPADGGGSTPALAVSGGQLVLGGLAFLDDDIDIPRSDSIVLRLGADPAGGAGLVLVRASGGVTPLGAAPACGSLAGRALNRPIVGIDRTSTGQGYWLVASDGGVFSFGDAAFAGSTGAIALNRPIVGMAADPDGSGYWLVASDGGVFAFDAGFFGSTGGIALNRPIVGMAATATGRGYWLVASDGGVFAFGDARFAGSMGGTPLTQPVVAMAADPDGAGYWLVASDGGVFAFDAAFSGSTGAIMLNRPIVGMVPDLDGGYWLVAADGGTFAFDAPFIGATTTPPFDERTVAAAG